METESQVPGRGPDQRPWRGILRRRHEASRLGSAPYTCCFLSHTLQFQFYKSLCDTSGHKGPLYECSFYGNKEAGQKYWAMLGEGSSQSWQKTMKELTGGEKIDASAVLEYFAPLQIWLKQPNERKSCEWQAATTPPKQG